MTDSVLVIGEALIDIVRRGDSAAEEHIGGSPANVALGLGRLGVPVRLRTALGRDARGKRITAYLSESGVDVDPESFVLERTSTAVASISPQGNARYEFDIDWRLDAPVRLDDARIVHVGSIGCFLEPGGSSLRRAIGSFASDARVTFDPNIRPGLVGDRATALAVTETIASLSDLVKLSDEDARWLYPDVAVGGVLDRFLALGARVVAVTLGGDGAVVASQSARAVVAPRPVELRDTVGAGDSFMAALVACLAQGRLGTDEASLRAVGDYAAAAAAMTVGRVGADLPTSDELDAMGLPHPFG